MALIETHKLSVDTRLKSVSFNLENGEMLGLIGPNGAGKSTLLNSLAGLVPTVGTINLNGNDFDSFTPKQRARIIGLQPQTVSSAWSIRVSDVVALGRIPWGDNDTHIIQQAMLRTGVTDFAHREIDHLSGGERARVWLARVLAGQPEALLVDEPVANLDIHYQLAVMDVLKHYADEGHGVIVAIHDLSLAARYCNRLCLLHQGKLVALGTPAEVLTESLLQSVYGVAVDVELDREPPVVLAR